MKEYIANIALSIYFTFLMLGSALGQEPSGYPIVEYLGMTLFPEVQVLPDAHHVAFIASKDSFATNRNDATIWKMDVDSGGRKTGMARLSGEWGEVSGIKWSVDSRYLAFKSARANSKTQLVVFDIERNKYFLVTTDKKFKNGFTAFDWSAYGRRIYFSVNDVPPPKENDTVFFPQPDEPDDHSSFYRLGTADLGRKEAQSFLSIDDSVVELALSPDKKTIAVNPFHAVFLLDIAGKYPFHRLTPGFPVWYQGMKWTRKGIIIAACGKMKDGQMVMSPRRIYWVDPATGRMEQAAPDFTGELGGKAEMPDGGLVAIGATSTKSGLYHIDALTRKGKEVEPYLGVVSQVSAAGDGNLLAFSVVNNNHYPELYIANGIDRMGSATMVTDFNAKLTQMPKPEVETVRWNNNEGDVIDGILYYPPGKKGAKNLPFIVSIHGGPYSTRFEALTFPYPYHWGYYPELLASRGYLVLDSNYRGSSGRGDAFRESVWGYPCSRPSTDVLAGVDYVVKQGWADPARLGIMGASNGGRVTNCIIGLTTRFKAAAATSGFWDLISGYGDSARGATYMGSKIPWEDMTSYWEESPMRHAAEIKTPTMIIIGADDDVVSPGQASEQHRALDRLGVPNELLLFPGEGHFFKKPSNMRIKLEAEIAWFDHYLLGKPLPKSK